MRIINRTTFAMEKMPTWLAEALPSELRPPASAGDAFKRGVEEIQKRLDPGESIAQPTEYKAVSSYDWFQREYEGGVSYLWEDEDAYYISVGILNEATH